MESSRYNATAIPVDERPNPEQIILDREEELKSRRQLLFLMEWIIALPVEQRYLIRRVFLDGVDPETVANTWGVPQRQLTRQLHVAVMTLRSAASDVPAPAKDVRKGGWLFLGSQKARAL